ncbi:HXXEE domain-containing protein [Levilactobacillus cerevisiae]|uniref:HXXEE domain-containing protein n=1 Tax=Levilactobacillus cerevisiae TaxID=1704076 RepID=UPI000F7A42B0|nr:HXXEE domain-containing protein [Levilactobacillus cerevisiae]
MKFYRQNWYFIGGIIFVGLAYFVGFWGNHLSHIQVILTYSYMAMLVHQFEEYGIPGGFPSIFNEAVLGEHTVPDRYPLNANQVMINNVFMTYPFYILAIIFPGAIWYGLIQIGQGMVQIVNHGFWNNLKLKRLYNPGEASVLLLHWPLGIYYIWYVISHHLATTPDLIIGFIGALASVFILWLGPVRILRNRQSKYPFTPQQMHGYTNIKNPK